MFFALDGLCLFPQTQCIKNFSSDVFFMVLRLCNFSDLGNLLRAGTLSVDKRSYPTSEVRGSGLECQAATAQEWQRGATLRPRTAVAGRRHPVSEVRGGDPRSHPSPRPGAAAGRSNPRSCGCAGTGGLRGAIPR